MGKVPGISELNNASAIAVLAGLAYETRLAVVQLLAEAGEDGLPAGEIARRLDVQKNTLSDHLRALSVAGIVTAQRMGRVIVYRANAERILGLITFMRETCVKAPTDI